MSLQLLSVFALLASPLLAKPIVARPVAQPTLVKRQPSSSSLSRISSTSADGVSTTTASDQSPTCVASYHATEDTKCEEVASEYSIQLSKSEATSLASSETCNDVLSGYRICVVITAPNPKLTTRSESASTFSNAPNLLAVASSETIVSTITATSMTTLTYAQGTEISTTTRTYIVKQNTTTVVPCTGTVTVSASSFGSSSTSSSSSISPSSATPSTSSGSSYSPSSVISKALNSTCSATASPPVAVQPGTVPGCTEWYVAEPGDYCYTVAQEFGISTDTFMAWNPSVEAPSCPRLLAGDAYCVATCGGASTNPSGPATTLTYSTSTSSYPLNPTTSSTYSYPPAAPSSTLSPLDKYTTYNGDGSVADGWPSLEQWVNFTYMFDANTANMKISCAQWTVPDDSDTEIAELSKAIVSVSGKTNIDPRFILAIIIQESQGCVRVITTSWSHNNPGLMQSYEGSGTCNTYTAASVIPGEEGNVTTPCPYSEIYQQILDGTNGTRYGPGLVQGWAQQGHTDVSGYYRTARIYNGGKLEPDGNLIGPCCTASYASDIANRLTGWVYAPRTFDTTGGSRRRQTLG